MSIVAVLYHAVAGDGQIFGLRTELGSIGAVVVVGVAHRDHSYDQDLLVHLITVNHSFS